MGDFDLHKADSIVLAWLSKNTHFLHFLDHGNLKHYIRMGPGLDYQYDMMYVTFSKLPGWHNTSSVKIDRNWNHSLTIHISKLNMNWEL